MTGPTRYEIEHVSRYLYTKPVRDCVMSLCLKPRDDSRQRLLLFEAATAPPSPLNSELDCFGNTKHVLNIHREHDRLEITVRSTVETAPAPPLPDSLDAEAWGEIRSWSESFTHWDYTHASALARPSPALANFVDRLRIERGRRPAGDAAATVGYPLPQFRIRPGEHVGSLPDRAHPGIRPGSLSGLRPTR